MWRVHRLRNPEVNPRCASPAAKNSKNQTSCFTTGYCWIFRPEGRFVGSFDAPVCPSALSEKAVRDSDCQRDHFDALESKEPPRLIELNEEEPHRGMAFRRTVRNARQTVASVNHAARAQSFWSRAQGEPTFLPIMPSSFVSSVALFPRTRFASSNSALS
jgi:hypothetical protein